MAEAEDILLYDVDDGVATMTLNRPERRNALNAALQRALAEGWKRVAADTSVRVLIVTGAGRAFCAGGDLAELNHSARNGTPRPDGPARKPRPVFARGLPVPVIAAINGPAIGAGLALALSADIRFGAPEASFSAGFLRVGATPELALTWTVGSLVGYGRATDMMLSGRAIRADEALSWGLITHLTTAETLMDSCRALAREMVRRNSPRAMRITKTLLSAGPEQTYDEALEMSKSEVAAAVRSPDFLEGTSAMRDKRLPQFPPDDGR
jgi:enoyl-CoA hydratase/carnithine racemase